MIKKAGSKQTESQYAIPDGLGSVRGVADDAVTTLESRSYAPYGEPFGVTGTNQTPYGFTGEYTDPTTGLVHLRARDYAPGLGTFTALDPFEGTAGRPMSLNGYSWVEGNTPNGAVGEPIFHNRYSYANANPVNLADPSGKYPIDIWTSAFIAPPSIPFLYFDLEGSIDPNAIWHGDGRTFYIGGQSSHPSARVWHEVEFDTNNPSINTTSSVDISS